MDDAAVGNASDWAVNATGHAYQHRRITDEDIIRIEIWKGIVFWSYKVLGPALSVPGALLAALSAAVFARHLSPSAGGGGGGGKLQQHSLHTTASTGGSGGGGAQQHCVRSLHALLLGMALFDMAFLLAVLVFLPSCANCWLVYDGRNCTRHYDSAGCRPHVFVPFLATSQCASVWMCVAVTVDRYLAIKHPLRARAWCTPPRAFVVVGMVAVFATVVRLPTWFEIDARGLPTALRDSYWYLLGYKTIFTLGLVILLPFTLLLLLNLFVYGAVRRAYSVRRRMTNAEAAERHTNAAKGKPAGRRMEMRAVNGSACSNGRAAAADDDGCGEPLTADRDGQRQPAKAHTYIQLKQHGGNGGKSDEQQQQQPATARQHHHHHQLHLKTFTMAFMVVGTFAVFFAPTMISNLLEAVQYRPEAQDPSHRPAFVLYQLLYFSSNVALCANSAANFAIYMTMCPWFRTELRAMLVGCCCTLGRKWWRCLGFRRMSSASGEV